MKRIAVLALLASPVIALAARPGGPDRFTDWSPAVNLGTTVNTDAMESCVAISKNGLSLYFSSTRQSPANPLDRDLYVVHRPSVDDPWGMPVPLVMLNSPTWDSCPQLSPDEHRLYFTTRRQPSCGLEDIWVSRRHDRRDDLGWEPPTSLGCEDDGGLNSAGRDVAQTVFEDEAGNEVMYFSRTSATMPLDMTTGDFYESAMRDDGTFGPPVLLSELSAAGFNDMGITVRRDGLEVFFLSGRPHDGVTPSSQSYLDFWRATRSGTGDPWSAPEFVPSLGNPAQASGHISLSFDGRELYFSSVRSGNMDLWVARREKLRTKD